MTRPTIFIGSSTEGKFIAEPLARGLSERFAVAPWWEKGTFPGRMPPLDVLLDELDRRDFAVLVGSDDDAVVHRGNLKSAMRDNVLFEFGLFMGRHGALRTQLILPDGDQFRVPSDLAGRPTITYPCGRSARRSLPAAEKQRLIDALSFVIEASWQAAEPAADDLARSRARRIYRFLSWSREQLGQYMDSGRDRTSVAERTYQILALTGFVRDDVRRLKVESQFDALIDALCDAAEAFPEHAFTRPDKDEILHRAAEGLRYCRMCADESRHGYRRSHFLSVPGEPWHYRERQVLGHIQRKLIDHHHYHGHWRYGGEAYEDAVLQEAKGIVLGIAAGAHAVEESLGEREETLRRWVFEHKHRIVSSFEVLEDALLDRTLVYADEHAS